MNRNRIPSRSSVPFASKVEMPFSSREMRGASPSSRAPRGQTYTLHNSSGLRGARCSLTADPYLSTPSVFCIAPASLPATLPISTAGPCPGRRPAKPGAGLPNFTAATRCPSFGCKLNHVTPQLAEGAVSTGWRVIAATSATLANRESTISLCSRSRRLRPFIAGPEVITPFVLEVSVVLQAPNDDPRTGRPGRTTGTLFLNELTNTSLRQASLWTGLPERRLMW